MCFSFRGKNRTRQPCLIVIGSVNSTSSGGLRKAENHSTIERFPMWLPVQLRRSPWIWARSGWTPGASCWAWRPERWSRKDPKCCLSVTHTERKRERDENRKELTGKFPMHPRNKSVTSDSTSSLHWKAARMKACSWRIPTDPKRRGKVWREKWKMEKMLWWFIHEEVCLSSLSGSLLYNPIQLNSLYQCTEHCDSHSCHN